MTENRGWHTLDTLGAQPGDRVRHILGNEHTIKNVVCRDYSTTGGFALRGDLQAWDIIERRTDREARMRDEQIAGTEVKA